MVQNFIFQSCTQFRIAVYNLIVEIYNDKFMHDFELCKRIWCSKG